MLIVIFVVVSGFLALNMGVSGFSVSFAPSYGSRILSRLKAALLYGLSVFAGGILIGPKVVNTLTSNISIQEFSYLSGFLILCSAGAMMLLSNALRIPQSTSFVAVASFLGAGLYYKNVNWQTIAIIIAAAFVLSLLSFLATFFIKKRFYPLHQKNLKYHQHFYIHQSKFRKFVVATNMYSAFGIGTNNVANVVAPIVGATAVNPLLALAVAGPLFGLGAYLSGDKVINTASRDIIPIGELSAAIISFITASFVITASLLGLPTPYVQFTIFSVLAISCIKDGVGQTFKKAVFKKIILVWILVPLFTVFLSFILHLIFIK